MTTTSADLAMFSGSDTLHQFSGLFRRHLLTAGAAHVAESCGAYWLFDAIASHHRTAMRSAKLQEMQIWILTKNKTGNGVNLQCFEDTGEGQKAAITQRIEYSDFFDEYSDTSIKFYVMPTDSGNWAIMLPSEY
jgi:hypothetical protein